MPKTLFRFVALLLVPCLLQEPALAVILCNPWQGIHPPVYTETSFASQALSPVQESFTSPSIKTSRRDFGLGALALAYLASGEVSEFFGEQQAPAAPQRPAAPTPIVDLSLQTVLRPGLRINQALDLLGQILMQVQNLKLSPEEAAARMGIAPAFQDVWYRQGILLLCAATEEAVLLPLAPLLNVPPPGQKSGLRFLFLAPLGQYTDQDLDEYGAFYSEKYRGIVFATGRDSDTWAHEYGHFLWQKLPPPIRAELVRRHQRSRKDFSQISEYAMNGNTTDKDDAAALAGQAFAEVVMKYMRHSDELFLNPEITGNEDLVYYIQVCANLFTFSKNDGKDYLRFYAVSPFSNNPIPETIDLELTGSGDIPFDNLLPVYMMTSASLEGALESKLPGLNAAEKVENIVALSERLKLSRSIAVQYFKLPAAAREIYMKYGIVVLTSSEDETKRVGAFLDHTPPERLADISSITFASPKRFAGVSEGTFWAHNSGKNLLFADSPANVQWSYSLGVSWFFRLPVRVRAEMDRRFASARAVFDDFVGNSADRAARHVFGAVIQWWMESGNSLFSYPKIGSDANLRYFVEQATLMFLSKDRKTIRFYRPRDYPNTGAPEFIDTKWGGTVPTYPDLSEAFFRAYPTVKRLQGQIIPGRNHNARGRALPSILAAA